MSFFKFPAFVFGLRIPPKGLERTSITDLTIRARTDGSTHRTDGSNTFGWLERTVLITLEQKVLTRLVGLTMVGVVSAAWT